MRTNSREWMMTATAFGLSGLALLSGANPDNSTVKADNGPRVTIVAPKPGTVLPDMSIETRWQQLPPDVTAVQVELTPFREDGPAVNMVLGDIQQTNRMAFKIKAPEVKQLFWDESAEGCTTLPDMTYLEELRASVKTNPDPNNDNDWGPRSHTVLKTPKVDASGATALKPEQLMKLHDDPSLPDPLPKAESTTPELKFMYANNLKPSQIWWSELRLSTDPQFRTSPGEAIAPVYQEFVNACVNNGGIGNNDNGVNTYNVKPEYALGSNKVYYWQVRPRIQGDGQPMPWGPQWAFKTP